MYNKEFAYAYAIDYDPKAVPKSQYSEPLPLSADQIVHYIPTKDNTRRPSHKITMEELERRLLEWSAVHHQHHHLRTLNDIISDPNYSKSHIPEIIRFATDVRYGDEMVPSHIGPIGSGNIALYRISTVSYASAGLSREIVSEYLSKKAAMEPMKYNEIVRGLKYYKRKYPVPSIDSPRVGFVNEFRFSLFDKYGRWVDPNPFFKKFAQKYFRESKVVKGAGVHNLFMCVPEYYLQQTFLLDPDYFCRSYYSYGPIGRKWKNIGRQTRVGMGSIRKYVSYFAELKQDVILAEDEADDLFIPVPKVRDKAKTHFAYNMFKPYRLRRKGWAGSISWKDQSKKRHQYE